MSGCWMGGYIQSKDLQRHCNGKFRLLQEEKGLKVYAYVIMTNHIHMIIQSKVGTLSDTVRDFKRYTSTRIMNEVENNVIESRREWIEVVFKYHAKYNGRVNDKQFWTHENHAVELTDNDIIDSKVNYIHENPVRPGWVANAEDYLYSSARNFSGLKSQLEIDLI